MSERRVGFSITGGWIISPCPAGRPDCPQLKKTGLAIAEQAKGDNKQKRGHRGQIVVFLKGWQQIGATYGATGKQVQAWREMGAPILLLGREPVAEAGQLWAWLLDNRAQVEAVPEAAGMTAAQAKKIIDGRPEQNLAGAILARG